MLSVDTPLPLTRVTCECFIFLRCLAKRMSPSSTIAVVRVLTSEISSDCLPSRRGRQQRYAMDASTRSVEYSRVAYRPTLTYKAS